MELDEFDEIFVQELRQKSLIFEMLFISVIWVKPLMELVFPSGTLEAVYVGDNLSISQLELITQGLI